MNKGAKYVRVNAKMTLLGDALMEKLSMLLGVDRQSVLELALRSLATEHNIDWISLASTIPNHEDGHEKS